MKQRLFNWAALVSIILLLALLVLWPATKDRTLFVFWCSSGGSGNTKAVAVGTVPGRIGLLWSQGPWELNMAHYPPWHEGVGFVSEDVEEPEWRWVFCKWMSCSYNDYEYPWFGRLMMADWLAALILAATPGIWVLLQLRRLRRLALIGCCSRCRYDLRGSPGPQCPECGAVIRKQVDQAA